MLSGAETMELARSLTKVKLTPGIVVRPLMSAQGLKVYIEPLVSDLAP